MSEKELTYGETIKQPFPKLEDIEWIMVETPLFLTSAGSISGLSLNVKLFNVSYQMYADFKLIHNNSKDFKVTWKLKQTDPHADIKTEYENDEIKILKKAKLEIEAMLNKKG